MKQHKKNKTNTLVRSQKKGQKKRRRGGSPTEDDDDEEEDDDDEDDVKVEDWQGRYLTRGCLI